MARGKLEAPNLDDRTWRDLVIQALDLIAEYTPEWTGAQDYRREFNASDVTRPRYAPDWIDRVPSDPGITLVELFAWLVEQMIYRLNRVPEKNYIAFLNLLGITRDPAVPASTWLTFQSQKEPALVPKGSQVSTQPSATGEVIVFETNEDLMVLPVNLSAWYQLSSHKWSSMANGLTNVEIKVDPNNGSWIHLGFDAPPPGNFQLHLGLSKPIPRTGEIVWRYSDSSNESKGPQDWPVMKIENDQTDGFKKSGSITLVSPTDWFKAEIEEIKDPKYWICIEIQDHSEQGSSPPLILGIEHLLFDSVSATNALTIHDENIGVSSGKPFQAFELKHCPVFKQIGAADPYGHLVLGVRDGETYAQWKRVEDFPHQKDQVFRLDPVTGTICFGDGRYGEIPTKGAQIIAKSYRYVAGGVSGNVGPNTLTVLYSSALKTSGISRVTNSGPATGGVDEEPLERAKQRAPQLLRNRYRAITAEDYAYLAQEITDVKKARALSPCPKFSYGGLSREEGSVNVIIVPAESSKEQPQPSEELLIEVQNYLDERRVLTVKPYVNGPRYLQINVKIVIAMRDKNSRNEPSKEIKRVEDHIKAFLHPVTGGPERSGWEIGQNVFLYDLLNYLQSQAAVDPGTGFISSALLKPPTKSYDGDRPGELQQTETWVEVADYETVCCGVLDVSFESARDERR